MTNECGNSFFFFEGSVLGASMRVTVDLTGAGCPECKKKGGVAKVCFRPTARYFWGCARYPACKGPRAWQYFDVPQQQRDECDDVFKASGAPPAGEKSVEGKKRVRAGAIPGDIGITMRVPKDGKVKGKRKAVKRVSVVFERHRSRLTFCRSESNEQRGSPVERAHAIGWACTWSKRPCRKADLSDQSARIGLEFP
jgi:ssDNA-binding Zn-finger/Zn-ribbon topoisomerase 1